MVLNGAVNSDDWFYSTWPYVGSGALATVPTYSGTSAW
jgi:hypothetical protein